MTADALKRKAAAAAIELVSSGMVVGLGTGSTAAHFIEMLGERVKDGLYITAIPTSEDTAEKARAAGIDLIEADETTVVDLAVDGTDEVDGRRNLIKGGGGALLREKIVAASARRFIVVADASKKVAQLGAFPLPVEIDPFAYGLTVRKIRETLSAQGYPKADLRLRATPAGSEFLSDGGNFILDCRLERIADARALDRALLEIPGVIESGLFIDLADEVFLAHEAGVDRLE